MAGDDLSKRSGRKVSVTIPEGASPELRAALAEVARQLVLHESENTATTDFHLCSAQLMTQDMPDTWPASWPASWPDSWPVTWPDTWSETVD